MPEIGMGGPRGQDEEVVRHLAVAQDEALVAKIHSGGVGEEDGRVALPPQDVAQGRRDVRRGEPGRGHLVEERLEDVMVVVIDEGDADGGAAEGSRRGEAGETPAHDDDVRSGRWRGGHRSWPKRETQRILVACARPGALVRFSDAWLPEP